MFVYAIPLRFLSVVVGWGGTFGEREGWLGIVGGGREDDGDAEDGGDGKGGDEEGKGERSEKKPWGELATFLLGKCVSVMEGMWDVGRGMFGRGRGRGCGWGRGVKECSARGV